MIQLVKSDFEPLYQLERFNCDDILISYLEIIQPKKEEDKQKLEDVLAYMRVRKEVVASIAPEINDFTSILTGFGAGGIGSRYSSSLLNTMVRKLTGKLILERQKYQHLEKMFNEMAVNELDVTRIIEEAVAKVRSIAMPGN